MYGDRGEDDEEVACGESLESKGCSYLELGKDLEVGYGEGGLKDYLCGKGMI